MRAVIVKEFGPIASHTVGELPTPIAGPSQAVVTIKAAAVNFVDSLVVTGKYQFLPERPFAPGKLPVGVVSALGAGVTDLKIGDRVLTLAEQGGYAEQVAVQNPAPPAGIVVTLSNIPADTQVCARDVDCGRPGTAVTIAGGSKAALFYLRPFPNVRRVGKRRFTISAVAKGCEMGTAGGTIDYDR